MSVWFPRKCGKVLSQNYHYPCPVGKYIDAYLSFDLGGQNSRNVCYAFILKDAANSYMWNSMSLCSEVKMLVILLITIE